MAILIGVYSKEHHPRYKQQKKCFWCKRHFTTSRKGDVIYCPECKAKVDKKKPSGKNEITKKIEKNKNDK